MNKRKVNSKKKRGLMTPAEYEAFLDSLWNKEHALLRHATLDKSLFDPLSLYRLLNDFSDGKSFERTQYKDGYKRMSAVERKVRKYAFFVCRHKEWSGHFEDYLKGKVPVKKLNAFKRAFAKIWVDGRARRQSSDEMMSIKASIRAHDKAFYRGVSENFVQNKRIKKIAPLLDADEMKAVFSANDALLESLMPDYLEELTGDRAGSINRIYVHRGMHIDGEISSPLVELNYLNSYSLAVTPVELFAQTWDDATKKNGKSAIMSAPLPAIQQRTVAFAPFIRGMTLQQLEIVVAPPLRATEIRAEGVHGDIREYAYE